MAERTGTKYNGGLPPGWGFPWAPFGRLMEGMRILGIDPGLGTVGFGVVNVTACGEFETCEWGVITTSKDKPEAARLQEIHQDLGTLVSRFKPHVVSIERIFFFKNAKTLIPVTQARGVIMLLMESMGVPQFEYTPMQVKQAMTGSGKAEKREVQQMVAQVLRLDKLPRPDDAADALALAVCHYQHSRGL
jgi:crossover junction endodeoxyribonuclease RuvC